MEQFLTYAPLLLMLIACYFFLIKPQQKRDRQEREMRNSVDVGDSITTIGGIVGRVVAVKEDDIIVLETGADRLKIQLRRWAIRSKDTVIE